MQILNRFSLPLFAALLVTAQSAFATQPPDPVSSDIKGNTAMGTSALQDLTSGSSNTASGENALQFNTTGSNNTASGLQALRGQLPAQGTGDNNAAFGYKALESNTTGSNNTASGAIALQSNASGSNNTASGATALQANTSGFNNTASGSTALQANTTGVANTASGFQALNANTTGGINTASGIDALAFNSTGSDNTAAGGGALSSNTTGSGNIALGYEAGLNLTTGNNNIDIGNVGVAGESNLIRIGTKGTHKGTVIAGIESSKITGSAVYVTTTGRLGVLASSERFKTGIAPMGLNTSKLEQLRPVTFHLKSDPKGALQYGLIAEEVAKVYPELVIRDERGRIDGVRYDELAPMLLNGMQKKNAAQDAEILDLKQQQLSMQQQMAELKALNQATQLALQELHAKDGLLAER